MASKRELVEWYLGTVSDIELANALNALGAAMEAKGGKGRRHGKALPSRPGKPAQDNEPHRLTPQEVEDFLSTAWKGKGREVPAHFLRQHSAVETAIRDMTVDETRARLDELAEEHGAPAVVLCCYYNGLKEKAELGFDLMERTGDQCRAIRGEEYEDSEDGETDGTSGTGGTGGTDETNGTEEVATTGIVEESWRNEETGEAPDIVGQLAEVLRGLQQSVAAFDETEFEATLNQVVAEWCAYKTRRSRDILAKVSALLSEVSEDYRSAMRYWALDCTLPTDIECYESCSPAHIEEVAAKLATLPELLSEFKRLRDWHPALRREEQTRVEQIDRIIEEIVSTVDHIVSLLELGPPVPPDEPPPGPPGRSDRQPGPDGSSQQGEAGRQGGDDRGEDDTQGEGDSSDTTLQEGESPPGEPPVQSPAWRSPADLAAAYWLARATEEHSVSDDAVGADLKAPYPSWLYYACFLASGERSRDPTAMRALGRECSVYTDPSAWFREASAVPDQGFVDHVVAAGLAPALFSDEFGPVYWLRCCLDHLGPDRSAVRALVSEVVNIRDSFGTGISVRQTQAGPSDWSSAAQDAASIVESWRQMALSGRLSYRPATQVRRYLAGQSSPLAWAIDAVRADRRERVSDVGRIVEERLADRRKMNDLVRSVTPASCGSRPGGIRIGELAQDSLMRSLTDLRDAMLRWVDAAEKAVAVAGKSAERVSAAAVRRVVEYAKQALSAVDSEFTVPGSASAVLAASIREAVRILEDGPGESPQWKVCLLRAILGTQGVDPAEASEWLDSGDIDEPLFVPTRASLVELLERGVSPSNTFTQALGVGDFTLAALALKIAGDEIPDGHPRYEASLKDASAALKRRLVETRSAVEEAALNHFISDDDRGGLDGLLMSLENAFESGAVRRFDGANQELDEVRTTLDRLHSQRVASMRKQIDDFEQHLLANRSHYSESVLEVALRYLGEARSKLDDNDLVLADDRFAAAESAAELGVDTGAETHRERRDYVGEFIEAQEAIRASLDSHRRRPEQLVKSIAAGRSAAGVSMADIAGKRAQEIAKGLGAYYTMKNRGEPSNEPWYTAALESVLRLNLGFYNPSLTMKNSDDISAHFVAKMQADDQSPLPEFGSMREGIYDVVAIHDRPGIVDIGHVLNKYGIEKRCPIIVYSARITTARRREWSAYCRESQVTAMLIDEVLLYYLASVRERYLEAAVSCGVAWGYAVPYTEAGRVPPEMFVGRQRMTTQLGEAKATCILYGGRQFGKTALLHMVVRKYHHPENGTYAWVDDIRNVGGPYDRLGPAQMWQAIWLNLRRRGLVETARDGVGQDGVIRNGARRGGAGRDGASPDAETIARSIMSLLERNPGMRILALLDEADNFIAADEKSDFVEISRIRSVMEQTNYRFKVVFSGVKNVQRYFRRANHPLAQLNKALVAGPLEPAAARELIVEPMKTLGVRFESENVVAKILSYTNYHPALIQVFCKRLLSVVRTRSDEPPFVCTMSDAQSIYTWQPFREGMRERFENTIGLDDRYEAIVYSMILSQKNESDGYRRRFEVSEIADLAHYWWPAGFEGMDVTEIRPFLDELVGLGVLMRCEDRSYHLRNGNVVRALGSANDISRALATISRKPAPSVDKDAVLLVRPASGGSDGSCGLGGQWGPLTLRQADELARPGGGLCLVFGSEALGASQIRTCLDSYLDPSVAGPDVRMSVSEAKHPFHSSRAAATYVRSQTGASSKGRYLIVSDASSAIGKDEAITDALARMHEELMSMNSSSRVVRWLIYLDPAQTVRWFDASSEDRSRVQSLLSAEAAIGKWSSEMVGYFLSSLEKSASVQAVTSTMEATGGWPCLMDRFVGLAACPRSGDEFDLGSLAELVDGELTHNTEGKADAFLATCGVDQIRYGRSLARLVAELDEVTVDDLCGIAVGGAADDPGFRGADLALVRASVDALLKCGILVPSSVVNVTCDHVVAKLVWRCTDND